MLLGEGLGLILNCVEILSISFKKCNSLKEVEILKPNLSLINMCISLFIHSFLYFCKNCQYVLMIQSQFMAQRQERSLQA